MGNVCNQAFITAKYSSHVTHSKIMDPIDLSFDMITFYFASGYRSMDSVVIGRTKIEYKCIAMSVGLSPWRMIQQLIQRVILAFYVQDRTRLNGSHECNQGIYRTDHSSLVLMNRAHARLQLACKK
ncbi:hypothetical protein D3C78_1625910 [compost metagenome]